MVAAGQEIPISGALVYLTSFRPDPIPLGAYCEYCVPAPATSTVTDHRGEFFILDYPPGSYWMVIEKGQFRREIEVTVQQSTLTHLPGQTTTLPDHHDPGNGYSIPKIAMAVGVFDQLETILGKMNLGSVNTMGGFETEHAGGEVDIWLNGGCCYDDVAKGTLTDLVYDLEKMLEYHIIFIPCSVEEQSGVLHDEEVLSNIRTFVQRGGKLYVTDWSGEWHDNVFPAHVELGGGGTDTPAEAFDAETGTWDSDLFGHADGEDYDTPNAEAVDSDLAAWLDGQIGPTAKNTEPSTYNADAFEVVGNWNFIESVSTVQVGTDTTGAPIYNEPRVFVVGGSEEAPLPKRPLTVTYEPAGCGRVLYSTYHTTDELHSGLVPQERVLLYLIMEIGICTDPKLQSFE
jgi:hypothetical protein